MNTTCTTETRIGNLDEQWARSHDVIYVAHITYDSEGAAEGVVYVPVEKEDDE